MNLLEEAKLETRLDRYWNNIEYEQEYKTIGDLFIWDYTKQGNDFWYYVSKGINPKQRRNKYEKSTNSSL